MSRNSNVIFCFLFLLLSNVFSQERKSVFEKIILRIEGRHKFEKFKYVITKNESQTSCNVELFDYNNNLILEKESNYLCKINNVFIWDKYKVKTRVEKDFKIPGSYVHWLELNIFSNDLDGAELVKRSIIVPNEIGKAGKGSLTLLAHEIKNLLNHKYLGY